MLSTVVYFVQLASDKGTNLGGHPSVIDNEFQFQNAVGWVAPIVDPLREKLQTLASMEQLEIVPVDGGIGGARLNDLGRKTLRDHNFLEFAEPETNEG